MDSLIHKAISAFHPENTFFAVRDITLPTGIVVAEAHTKKMNELSGVKFPVTFLFAQKNGMFIFYKTRKEYDEFSKVLGEKCVKDTSFANYLRSELVSRADSLEAFLDSRPDRKDFVDEKKVFFEEYADFFGFHQAVYYAGEYINKHYSGKETKELIDSFREAYRYNEEVVPDIDNYFKKTVKIEQNTIEEIGPMAKEVQSNRSVLLLDKKIHLLDYLVAEQIHNAIQKKYLENMKTVSEIKGSIVSHGKVEGVARVITDLAEQGKIQPGEIIITPQTRPQYNHIIAFAKAIVTDEGGQLAHAAILAREKEIPCITGTINATRIIKTGDLILVDADRGIIKILERAKHE